MHFKSALRHLLSSPLLRFFSGKIEGVLHGRKGDSGKVRNNLYIRERREGKKPQSLIKHDGGGPNRRRASTHRTQGYRTGLVYTPT